jgi:hypothetical protein
VAHKLFVLGQNRGGGGHKGKDGLLKRATMISATEAITVRAAKELRVGLTIAAARFRLWDCGTDEGSTDQWEQPVDVRMSDPAC